MTPRFQLRIDPGKTSLLVNEMYRTYLIRGSTVQIHPSDPKKNLEGGMLQPATSRPCLATDSIGVGDEIGRPAGCWQTERGAGSEYLYSLRRKFFSLGLGCWADALSASADAVFAAGSACFNLRFCVATGEYTSSAERNAKNGHEKSSSARTGDLDRRSNSPLSA